MSERVWKTLLVISLIAYLWKFSQWWSHFVQLNAKIIKWCLIDDVRADRHIIFQDASDMPYQVCIISSIWGWAQGHFNSCQEILFSLPFQKTRAYIWPFRGEKKTRTKASNLSQPTPALSSKLSSSECLAHLIPEDLRQAGWKGPSIPWKEQNTNVAVDLLWGWRKVEILFMKGH